MYKRGLRAAVAAGAFMSLGLGGAALAQTPEVPTPPIPAAPAMPAPPEPPPEAQPLADGTTSGTYTACQAAGAGTGAFSSAASLASLGLSILGATSPVALPGVAVPTEAYSYVGLAQYPCAYAPAPEQISHCGADREIDAVVDTVYDETGAGFATIFAPVNLPKLGPIVDLAVAIEALAAESGAAPLPVSPAAMAYEEMDCEDVLAGVGVPGAAGTGGSPAPAEAIATPSTSIETSRVTPAALASAASIPPMLAVGSDQSDPGAAGEIAAPVVLPDASPVAARERWQPWRVLGIALTAFGLLALSYYVTGSRVRFS